MTPLSARQHQILVLVAEGNTTTEIAAQLGLTDATVKTHLRKVFARLGVGSRAHAVAQAFRTGVLS